MHPDPTKVTPKGARMMRTKRNNFYRRWREAENAGRRTAWRRLARRAGPAAVTAAAALLLWGGLGFHTACLRRETAALTAWCETPENAAAYAQSEADRARAAALQADQAQLEQLWTLLDSYPDPTGTVLAALEDAQAGVHVQLHSYDAASGTLTFSAVLPQVVDIPAYVRRLEGSGLFAQVAYGGYETGADGYTLQLDCVLAAPESGAKEAAP